MGNQPPASTSRHMSTSYTGAPGQPPPYRPSSSSTASAASSQQQVQQVRCPSCSKVLRPPPGAARFRCPCGKVLGAPNATTTPPPTIPSQTRSLAPQQNHTPIQSQTRSVPPTRPPAQQQQPPPSAATTTPQRVRCPRCQQILIPPNGAPQFSCPCGQMLRAPQPSTTPVAQPVQRPAPAPPSVQQQQQQPASAPAPARRVRCPNCSRVLECPPGARVFRCQCGVHLTAPASAATPAAAPTPAPAAAAAAAATPSTPTHTNENAFSNEMLPQAEAMLAERKDVGTWSRRLAPGDSRLGWINLLSETDESKILHAEQIVMDSITPTGLETLSNTELKRRLQRFGDLVDLSTCLEREDLVNVALNLSMHIARADLVRAKCAEFDLDISKCVDEDQVSQRLFAYLWSDGRTIKDNVAKNDGFVRTVTAQGTLQWTRAEEFQIPMGAPERALEVYRTSLHPSFVYKTQWFRAECAKLLVPWEQGHVKVVVKRATCLEDAFNHVHNLPSTDLHRYFRYEFHGEPGLDAGGIAREWFTLVSDQVFNADVGLMEYSQAGNLTYQISANSHVANGSGHLAWFKFIGRLLGRALFEGQQIGPHLSRILYKHMLAWPIVEADLEFVDDEMFRSLQQMREMESGVEDLCLDFTTTKSVFGENLVVELCPNGADREVTKENLDEFLELRLKYSCLGETETQLFALLNGFYEVIPIQLLSVFNFLELELLLCGLPKIDVEDWRKNTAYRGAFAQQGMNHPVVKMFWELMEESNEEQRAKFLQFATGTSRVPVQGFSALQGNDGNVKLFTIDSLELSQSVFPRAHTCFNRVDLPIYLDKAEMKFRIAQALQLEGVGFQIE